MPTALESKTDAEINNWIGNHEVAGKTSAPLYLQLLEERARRAQSAQRLDFARSLEHLKRTAQERTCTSYGALAAASGVEWSKAGRQMNGPNGDLDRLLDICHARGLPMLTPICVNQSNVADGVLAEEALSGFVASARRLSMAVDDPVEFHRRCRDECWEWGGSEVQGGA